jgi:hypothetical protein
VLFLYIGFKIRCLAVFESSERMFERSQKTSLYKMGEPKFPNTMFVYFSPAWTYFRRVKNYSFWPEFHDLSRHVLGIGICFGLEGVKKFLNGLKIDFRWWTNIFLLTPIHSFAMMLKSVWVNSFVEQIFLFKMWCRTKLKLKATSIFSRAAFLCKPRQSILLKWEL